MLSAALGCEKVGVLCGCTPCYLKNTKPGAFSQKPTRLPELHPGRTDPPQKLSNKRLQRLLSACAKE